ncbi:MAG: phospholipase, partial [bacterium]
MKIEENTIKIEKSARFYLNEPSKKNIKSVWIVLHGYAQLAKDFINEFDFLSDEDTLIITPEGLSKFYFKDKIAASWMTKEDRSNEIND